MEQHLVARLGVVVARSTVNSTTKVKKWRLVRVSKCKAEGYHSQAAAASPEV